MKIKTMTIGFGNTCGPKFEPVKVYVEYTAEFNEDDDGEAEKMLGDKCLMDVHDWCLEALLRLKGEQERNKYESERTGKEGV